MRKLITLIALWASQSSGLQPDPTSYIIGVNRSEHNVSIIDPNRNEVIKKIPVGIGPHEVSVSPDGTYAIVFNYGEYPEPHTEAISSSELKWRKKESFTVTKIDLTNLEATDTWVIEGCSTPHHGLINDDSRSFWATCEVEKKIVQIDAQSGVQLKAINIGQIQTHFMAKARGKLVTTNIGSNSVSFINPERGTVNTIEVGQRPEGIGVSPDGSEVWVLCFGENKIYVLDPDKEEVIDSFDSGSEFPIEIQFRPGSDEVWVSNVTSKEITIYSARNKALINRIALPSTGLGLLISPDGSRAYISLPRLNKIQVIETDKKAVLSEFSSGLETDGLVWITRPKAR